LTSTAITATSAGSKSAELRYKAWGETRYTYGTTPTTYHFTGQREESTIGLYFYNARWYDAALARFAQADTIVPEPGNPQALNRYAYTLNNPVKYTDPSGHRVLLEDETEDYDEFSVVWREGAWYILFGGRWYRNYYERAFGNYFLGHSRSLPPPASGAFAGTIIGSATNAYQANEGIESAGSGLSILSDPVLVVGLGTSMLKAVGVAKDEFYSIAQKISGQGGTRPNAIGRWGVQQAAENYPMEAKQFRVAGGQRVYDGYVQSTGQFVEVKTTTRGTVYSNARIQGQIAFDAAQEIKPLWIFVNGNPSRGLQLDLGNAGIPWEVLSPR
jgi:RHS repeat-associated protein